MKLIYAREPLVNIQGKSLFLAGPTPRSSDITSWRNDAINLLMSKNTELTVLIPEDRNGIWDESINFEEQIEWEESALKKSDCILFWIPRDLTTLPGFTTNIEFGAWKESGKLVLGFPPNTPKMKYLAYYAQKLQIPTSTTLSGAIDLSYQKLSQN